MLQSVAVRRLTGNEDSGPLFSPLSLCELCAIFMSNPTAVEVVLSCIEVVVGVLTKIAVHYRRCQSTA